MNVIKFIKNHYFSFMTQTRECTREQNLTVPRMVPKKEKKKKEKRKEKQKNEKRKNEKTKKRKKKKRKKKNKKEKNYTN